jgi:hypothetical protein
VGNWGHAAGGRGGGGGSDSKERGQGQSRLKWLLVDAIRNNEIFWTNNFGSYDTTSTCAAAVTPPPCAVPTHLLPSSCGPYPTLEAL